MQGFPKKKRKKKSARFNFDLDLVEYIVLELFKGNVGVPNSRRGNRAT